MFQKIGFVLFIVLNSTLTGQVPELDWAYTFGGTGEDIVRASAQDAQGNLIQVGFFHSTVDFDNSTGTAQKTVPTNSKGMFVQKIDASGKFLWVQAFSGSGNCTGHRVAVDALGNIYVSGYFDGATQDFDPDPSTTFTLNRGNYAQAMFVLKLNAQGAFKWAIAQSGATSQHEGLSLDTLGNIYAVGNFSSPLDSDPSPSNQTIVNPSSGNKQGIFIQKIDTSGVQKWFTTIKGTDDVVASAITINASQNPVFAGNFKGTADFDAGNGTHNLTATSTNKNGYVVELDSSANYVTASLIQGDGNSKCIDIQMDNNQSIYIAGEYDGYVDFDPGIDTLHPRDSSSMGGFIQKLTPNGNMAWTHPYENSLSSSDAHYISVQVDNFQNVFVSGKFRRYSLDLEPLKSNGLTLTCSYGGACVTTMFIAKHDPNGDVLWGHNFSTYASISYTTLLSPHNQLIISGFYGGSLDPDPYSNLQEISNGDMDCLILKFKSCNYSIDTTFQVSACGYYEISPSNRIFNDSLLVDTVFSVMGCDSIITRDVKINHLALITAQNGTLSWDSTSTGPFTFSWYDCDSMRLIPGETSKTYKPQKNGSYALIVNDGNCIDTSSCILVSDVSMPENIMLNHDLSIFPNPTSGTITVESNSGVHIEQVDIFNLSGQLLSSTKNSYEIDMKSFTPSVYFLHVKTSQGVLVRKVIKR